MLLADREVIFSRRGYWVVFLISLAGYVLFGYFLSRQNFLAVMSTYLVLFAGYVYVLKGVPFSVIDDSKYSLQIFTWAAILFRLLFLFSIPRLSDDYFRFLWDGNLSASGINPYSITPLDYMQQPSNRSDYLAELFVGINSQGYHSVYPPVLQFIFFIAGKLFPGNLVASIVSLRIVIIAAETGSILLLQKILQHFHLPKSRVLLYALNPLVIIELSGNLHAEAIMIFFLLAATYFLTRSLREKISLSKARYCLTEI
jgi:hypothetical protein